MLSCACGFSDGEPVVPSGMCGQHSRLIAGSRHLKDGTEDKTYNRCGPSAGFTVSLFPGLHVSPTCLLRITATILCSCILCRCWLA